jgi:hypothetical protein
MLWMIFLEKSKKLFLLKTLPRDPTPVGVLPCQGVRFVGGGRRGARGGESGRAEGGPRRRISVGGDTPKSRLEFEGGGEVTP